MAKLSDYQYELTLTGIEAFPICDNGVELDRYVEDALSKDIIPKIKLVRKQEQEEPDELTKVARKGSGLYEEKS